MDPIVLSSRYYEYLFTFLLGRDPRRIEFLIQYLMQQCRFPPGALTLAAISALDHCLWDISAKALGVPVYMLLGGHVRDRVKVYAGVYTAPDAPAARDELDRLNEGWGFTAFKLSPYRVNIHQNRWGEVVRTSAEYFRTLRETVRNDYEIAFDAHAHIFEPQQAVQFGNALAPYDPLFFEEPIRPENVEAWGDMKRQMTCTLATGESSTTASSSCGCCQSVEPTSSSPTSASSAGCSRCARSRRSRRHITSQWRRTIRWVLSQQR